MKYPYVILFRYDEHSYIDEIFNTNKDKLLCSVFIVNNKEALNKLFNCSYQILVTYGNGAEGTSGESDDNTRGENDDVDEEDVEIVDEIDDNKEDIEYDEIEKLYQTEDVDKNADEVKEMIDKILDEDIEVKQSSYLINFNNKKDDDIENENLAYVYNKNFVYSFYIFKDDNIKIVKNKIACSIKNNSKFGKINYIIPSRMYIWAEYLVNNKLDKISIGHR